MTVWGADVSAIQGKIVPFGALKDKGASFVFLRCKVGNDKGKDAYFEANVTAAKEAGLIVGAYQFAYPLPHLSPRDQAEAFVEAATIGEDHDVGGGVGELPMALDLEWPPPEEWSKWHCTANQIRDWGFECLQWLRTLTGFTPILYTYPFFWRQIVATGGALPFASFPLWIAGGKQYQNGNGHIPDTSTEAPPMVEPWGAEWAFWQYDGNGGARLPNGTDADFNVFNGTLAKLRAMAGERDQDSIDTLPDPNVTAALRGDVMIEDAIRAYRQTRIDA